jgi:hypothetical protein
MSARRWRKKHGDYWRRRRRKRPEVVKRNRFLQRRRDGRKRRNLANINSIGAVYSEKLNRIELLVDLANINSSDVSWMSVSEEMIALLRWSSRLANIKPIGRKAISSAQSHA